MKSEPIKDHSQWLREKLKADKKDRRQKLREARKEAKQVGKEAFSFKKLCCLYDPTSDIAPAGTKPSRETRASLEYKYYVYCPEIMSIEEFVSHLEMMDVYNS